ncbi:MAG: DNA-protecting protein DprA [Magnetococcales bacterium]|nr:DNA-protecting protein DprA [Magnetococcales bacterium]
MESALFTDWLRLVRSPGMGAATLIHLVRHLGSFSAVLAASPKQLATVPNMRPALSRTLEQFRLHSPAAPIADELERLHAMGGRMLIPGEADYPPLLAAIHDPPPALFVLGDPALLQGDGPVTVTGTRKASRSGLEFAFTLGRDLAQSGMVTVSGLATGIDAAAHRGALANRGATVGVLATGLNVAYPRSNRELQQNIATHGCLVTEAPLGVLPVPWLFPPRSRILSGLSRGVVIVEAPEGSGALITARMALEQGREVFAVPGLANNANTRGTHELLRQGARLTEGVNDILEELNWPVRPPPEPSEYKKSTQEQHPLLGGDAASVLACIGSDPLHEDELARCCQLTVIALSRILLQLELSGVVERLPGGRYARITSRPPP